MDLAVEQEGTLGQPSRFDDLCPRVYRRSKVSANIVA